MSVSEEASGLDHQIKLVRRNTLLQEFVLADGIGSSGKAMMSHVIASFKRVEKTRIDMLFDTVPRLYMLGKISHDAAVTIMQTESDMLLYHTMMSRGVNFRFTDGTGVFQNPYPWRYVRRLFSKERSPVVERIRKGRPIFQNVTHDALRNAEILFDAFEEQLRIVYIVRDPVEIIHDWHRRGFGTRIGTDPQEFQFSYEWKGDVVPLYAYGWESEYLSSAPIDRNIGMVGYHVKGNMESYHKLSPEQKARVMFVLFDELASNPMPVCEKMASFIGTAITSQTKRTLRRENCPRIVSLEQKQRKRQSLEQGASARFRKMLGELVQEYEAFIRDKLRGLG
jgi:hypothetical protein